MREWQNSNRRETSVLRENKTRAPAEERANAGRRKRGGTTASRMNTNVPSRKSRKERIVPINDEGEVKKPERKGGPKKVRDGRAVKSGRTRRNLSKEGMNKGRTKDRKRKRVASRGGEGCFLELEQQNLLVRAIKRERNSREEKDLEDPHVCPVAKEIVRKKGGGENRKKGF